MDRNGGGCGGRDGGRLMLVRNTRSQILSMTGFEADWSQRFHVMDIRYLSLCVCVALSP